MTVPWFRLTVDTRPGHADDIAAWLVRTTGSAVEETPSGALHAMVPSEMLARDVAAQLTTRFGATVACAAVDVVDWTTRWRDGIIARRFGRLLLTPSWLPVDPDRAAGDVVVVLDPQSAFGSGEHGSTRGALTLLARLLHPGDRVLDLGSGSGILAIAALKLGAGRATGVEIDEASLPIAGANAANNGVPASFLAGDALALTPLLGPADLICSNILRSVNTVLAPVIAEALAPGGTAIFAGMEAVEADLFRPVLDAAGLDAGDEVRDDGWWSIAARRR